MTIRKNNDGMNISSPGKLGSLDFELGMAEGTRNQLRHMVGEAKIHLGIVWSQDQVSN